MSRILVTVSPLLYVILRETSCNEFCRSVGVDLTLDDFQKVSDEVPFIADLKPSGKYVMEDVHKVCTDLFDIFSLLIVLLFLLILFIYEIYFIIVKIFSWSCYWY